MPASCTGENRVQHQHTIKVAVIDPSTAHTPVTYERVREGIARTIPHLEPFRWRAVKAPLFPWPRWWVEDPQLDIDYHVRRAPHAPRRAEPANSPRSSPRSPAHPSSATALSGSRASWRGLADGPPGVRHEDPPLARRRPLERGAPHVVVQHVGRAIGVSA